MLKLGHVISPWPNGLGSNFGWFSETSNQALSRGEIKKTGFFLPSWCNLGFKKCRFCKKTCFFPRYWWRHHDIIMTSQNYFTYAKRQFSSIPSKRVVAISSISFSFLNIRPPNLVVLLSVSIYVVNVTLSIYGAWQVLANVCITKCAITFERINIFTWNFQRCLIILFWIFCQVLGCFVTRGGVRALARAQISYKTARVVRLTPLWLGHRVTDISP